LLVDLERQARIFSIAQPKPGGKARLPTRKQIIERENAECHGGLRNSRSVVRGSSRAQKLGTRLRKTLEKALKIPGVREAMSTVVSDLGTERAACPRAAVDAARKVLCEEFEITIDENIGEGKSSDTRSWYFANLWQKNSPEESGDPETDLPEWLRSGAPVGGKGALVPNGVFPTVDGDTEAVKKSAQCGQGSQDGAVNAPATCSPNYNSFDDAGSQADAEVKRSLQKGFTR
jgi:hypothetical protein